MNGIIRKVRGFCKYKGYYPFRRYMTKKHPKFSKKVFGWEPWTFSQEDFDWLRKFAELINHADWDKVYAEKNSAFEEVSW